MLVRNNNCAGITAIRPGPYHISRLRNTSKIARFGCSAREGEKKERLDKTKTGQKIMRKKEVNTRSNHGGKFDSRNL
jgi:hypothetical protein